jgi:hypothetical protein
VAGGSPAYSKAFVTCRVEYLLAVGWTKLTVWTRSRKIDGANLRINLGPCLPAGGGVALSATLSGERGQALARRLLRSPRLAR